MAAPLAPEGTDRTPGGSLGGGWRAFLKLTAPALSWEFLRRNASYRDDYARFAQRGVPIARTWGLSAPADPDLGADAAAVVWREDVAPGLVVPVERASFAPSRPLPDRSSRLVEGVDGRHIRLPSGLQVLLRGDAPATGPLVVVLAYDKDFHLRVRAVDALRRADLTDAPPHSRFSQLQRERLARSLFAVDAALRHRSHREIARDLFGDADTQGPAFATSTVRDVTARLVRRGRALVAGGYLKLVRAGF